MKDSENKFKKNKGNSYISQEIESDSSKSSKGIKEGNDSNNNYYYGNICLSF